jgi:hypothetical protein
LVFDPLYVLAASFGKRVGPVLSRRADDAIEQRGYLL